MRKETQAMSLSSRVKNKLVDSINTCFASIGHAAGMKMPKCESNLAPAAWEYFVAKHVYSLAGKRKDAAEKAAIEAGVIFDSEKTPHQPGREMTFNGEIIAIALQVREGSERVNVVAFEAQLRILGVKQSIIDKAREAATTTSRPAHIFTPYLVTDGADNGK
jgi:hypothetical protein